MDSKLVGRLCAALGAAINLGVVEAPEEWRFALIIIGTFLSTLGGASGWSAPSDKRVESGD